MRVVGLLTVVGRLGLDRGIVALGTAVSLTRSAGTTLTVSAKSAALAVIVTVKAAALAIVSVSAEAAALTVIVTVKAAFTVSIRNSLTVIIAGLKPPWRLSLLSAKASPDGC